MSLTAFKAPEWVIAQAARKLTQYRRGRLFARRTYRRGYLSLAVNPRWRLLSRNGGRDWQLMSHSDYNQEIEK